VGGYNKWTDQGAVVGKDKHGDVYVGRDGNVYKRSGESWQRNSGDGWKSIDTTKARSQAQSRANNVQSRVSSGSSSASRSSRTRSSINRSQQNRSSVQRDLNRNFQSRQRGDRFTRSSSSRSRSVGRGRSRR
jgi:hypothetical protein